MGILVGQDRVQPLIAQAHKRHADAVQFAKMEFTRQTSRGAGLRAKAAQELAEGYEGRKKDLDASEVAERSDAQTKGAARSKANETWHDREVAELRAEWEAGLARIQAPIEDTARVGGRAIKNWDDPAWRQWDPPSEFP